MTRWTFRILFLLMLGVVTTVGVAWGLANLSKPARFTVGLLDPKTAVWEVHPRQQPAPSRAASPPSSSTLRRSVSILHSAEINRPRLLPSNTFHLVWLTRVTGCGSEWIAVIAAEYALTDEPGRHHQPLVLPALAKESFLLQRSGWPGYSMASAEISHAAAVNDTVELAASYCCNLMPDDDLEEIAEVIGYVQPIPRAPLRPIFPGFIINTLFYAAIWFAILFAVGSARRAFRHKHGRCPNCNYDLRGTSGSRGGGGCPECGWNRALN